MPFFCDVFKENDSDKRNKYFLVIRTEPHLIRSKTLESQMSPNMRRSVPSLAYGRHLNSSDSAGDIYEEAVRKDSRQSRNSVSSASSLTFMDAAQIQLYLQKKEASIFSPAKLRLVFIIGELSNGRNSHIQVTGSMDIGDENIIEQDKPRNGEREGVHYIHDVNEEIKSINKEILPLTPSPTHRPEFPPFPQTRTQRPRSQYIGDTVWQVDDTVFCGGMESVMNQNLLCRLHIEYIVDLTGLDEEHLPRYNRRTECPCLCARKTQHSRMIMAISVTEEEGPNAPRQDFISFFEDFVHLISRAKSCNKCVLVHSIKGRNRAPAFIAAYLMHNKHITRVQAVAKVGEMMSRMRPGLQISDTLQRALMRWQTVLGIRSNDTSSTLDAHLAVPLFTIKRTAWT
ncbi:hypothetical protein L596_000047 [Steinernema carpocapsae]|uniref:protein-tyrosine-phosphatase n=1 Tax=Steinernema carpocapsae TaxID=34508 RepID=A0A4U8UL34_STECR|nr:hypothetical protein L596_000047 [Steinernema carpocapsae]